MIPSTVPVGRQARRLLAPSLRRAASTPGADHYRKHFPAVAHLWLLVLHGLSGFGSLRQSHAAFAAVPRLFAQIGLRRGLSYSQLARSSTSRPAGCVEALAAALVARAERQISPDPHWRLLRQVQLSDSTFLALSLKLSPWSRHGGHVPGVRVQTLFELGRRLPRRLWLTLADINDHDALKHADLGTLAGWTLVFDLGYYGHRQFARLQAAGVSFLSRLHPQASYRVTAKRAVAAEPTPDGDVVLRDETITLGSPNNRAGAVLPGLRLVTSRNADGKVHRFVTDRVDLSAAEVAQLYRKRWQIELFFRFLKQQLQLATPLGHSRAAVWLTVLVAVIVAVLLVLLEADRPPAVSRIAWLRAVATTLTTTLRGG